MAALAELPLRVRIGEGEEHELGTLALDTSESVYEAMADALQSAAAIIREQHRPAGTVRPPHNATVYQQYEANHPGDHVATRRRTGLACLVCNCGTVTGWVTYDSAMTVAAAHRIELD